VAVEDKGRYGLDDASNPPSMHLLMRCYMAHDTVRTIWTRFMIHRNGLPGLAAGGPESVNVEVGRDDNGTLLYMSRFSHMYILYF
jgi:hypothetical protein